MKLRNTNIDIMYFEVRSTVESTCLFVCFAVAQSCLHVSFCDK